MKNQKTEKVGITISVKFGKRQVGEVIGNITTTATEDCQYSHRLNDLNRNEPASLTFSNAEDAEEWARDWVAKATETLEAWVAAPIPENYTVEL